MLHTDSVLMKIQGPLMLNRATDGSFTRMYHESSYVCRYL